MLDVCKFGLGDFSFGSCDDASVGGLKRAFQNCFSVVAGIFEHLEIIDEINEFKIGDARLAEPTQFTRSAPS